MKKPRFSYSSLSLAEKGRWDELVYMLFKVDRPITKAMEEGRKIHEDIEKHIITYNSFPDWLFSGELVLPTAEEKVIIEHNEHFNLSGIFDCYDSATKTLYEFKTGVQSSTDWARTHQIPIYFYMLEKIGREVDKAFLIHYNQHTQKKDWTVVHNSKSQIEKAKNYIDTYGYEILNFMEKEGLI